MYFIFCFPLRKLRDKTIFDFGKNRLHINSEVLRVRITCFKKISVWMCVCMGACVFIDERKKKIHLRTLCQARLIARCCCDPARQTKWSHISLFIRIRITKFILTQEIISLNFSFFLQRWHWNSTCSTFSSTSQHRFNLAKVAMEVAVVCQYLSLLELIVFRKFPYGRVYVCVCVLHTSGMIWVKRSLSVGSHLFCYSVMVSSVHRLLRRSLS